MKTFLVPAAVALAAALTAPARANMILNGTLDIPDNPALFTKYPTYEIVQITPRTHPHILANWTIAGDSIDIVTKSIWPNSPSQYCVDLVGTAGPGSISQTISNLTPGLSYQLSFDLSANPSNGKFGGESLLTKWLDISLTNTPTPDFYFNANPAAYTVSNMEWIHRALTFTPTGTSSTLTFSAIFPQHLPTSFPDGTPLTPHNFYAGPVIANIDLESLGGSGTIAPPPPTPEPATLLLRAPFACSAILRRRKTA